MNEEGLGRVLEFFIRSADEGSAGSSSDDGHETNHTAGHEGAHSDHGGHANSGTVLFLFAAFAVGGKPLPLPTYVH